MAHVKVARGNNPNSSKWQPSCLLSNFNNCNCRLSSLRIMFSLLLPRYPIQWVVALPMTSLKLVKQQSPPPLTILPVLSIGTITHPNRKYSRNLRFEHINLSAQKVGLCFDLLKVWCICLPSSKGSNSNIFLFMYNYCFVIFREFS